MTRLRTLTAEFRALKERVEGGGGPAKVRRQHEQGKLTARERVAALFDRDRSWFEVGLLMAYDRYDGHAPAAGVVTGLGLIGGAGSGRRERCDSQSRGVVAGDDQEDPAHAEMAMRQRIPIVYLVDSAGVNLPYQGGVFPGQYGAARLFYYNSLMRRYLRVPQIAAVMGPCIAGGAYLPALSDVIFMVEGTSFMGLGGPNLVKGATGQTVDAEALGGAATHTVTRAVAHSSSKSDRECLSRCAPTSLACRGRDRHRPGQTAAGRGELYDLLLRIPHEL